MDSETDDEMLAFYLLKKRKKTFWVRDIYLKREQLGEYHQYVPQLWEDPPKSQNYSRISMHCYNKLILKVTPHFNRGYTNYRKTISFEERLTVTLRFLAVSEPFSAASHHFCIFHNQIGIIIKEMVKLIYNTLHVEYLPFPTQIDWFNIAKGFERKKFPNCCIGAIDGKHVRIKKPGNAGSNFYNYKSFHSIVLMALVDAEYKFLMVDAGSFGKNSDGGIFDHSAFGRDFYNNAIDIPQDKRIVDGGEPLQFVFIGDEAFRLTRNFMKPYPRRQLTQEKRTFNYRLSYARQSVECTFGALTSKFRLFETLLGIKPETVDDVIKCAFVLHNMIRTEDKEMEEITGCQRNPAGNNSAFERLPSLRNLVNQSSKEARAVREHFTAFFNGIGAVPFQNNII